MREKESVKTQGKAQSKEDFGVACEKPSHEVKHVLNT